MVPSCSAIRVFRLLKYLPLALISKVIAAYGGEENADDTCEEKDEGDGPTPRRAPIGPAMPSQAMLAQAQQAAMDYVDQVRLWSCHCRRCWIYISMHYRSNRERKPLIPQHQPHDSAKLGFFQSRILLVRQSSSSEDDEDDFGPSVAGKEKRVASERYVRCSGLALV